MVGKAIRKSSTAQTNPRTSATSQTGDGEVSHDSSSQGSDAVAMLKADHREVESMFAQCQADRPEQDKQQLVLKICESLSIHSILEDEIFYAACREHGVDTDLMDEAQVEHDCAALLIAQLMTCEPDAPYYDAKVKVLSEYIQMHVREEEKPSSGIFAKAKSAGLDMSALGQRLKSRKQELEAEAQTSAIQPPTPRSLGIQDGVSNMASRYPERDDQGRFVSDRSGDGRSSGDDRRSSRYDDDNRSSMRSRYDDDDRGRYGGQYGSQYGRDDDRYGGGRGSDDRGRYSRGRDDDDRGSYRSDDRGRSHGGWFGDSEGHSRAAERGWNSRYDDRDDNRGRMSGRDDDRGGRSSSRDRDDDRGQGGWFGDSRGHSMAAQRGWDSRRDDDNRSSSRSRDDDDDRGSSRGRGQGGWFGDYEGHSEASRRGWESRRDDDDRSGSRSGRGR